jgi:flagellar hook-length control protein FliK
LESAPGLNFGAVLSKQLRGIASLQASAPAAESGDGLGSAPGLNLGAVLSKQLKGIASLLGKKEEAGPSLAVVKEGAEPAANAGATVLPVDMSVLAASMLVPALPAQAGGGDVIPAEAGANKPLMQLPIDGKARLAAEIAANGKNLPQAVPPEQRFADKLAALVEVPAGNAGGRLHSTDLSGVVSPPGVLSPPAVVSPSGVVSPSAAADPSAVVSPPAAADPSAVVSPSAAADPSAMVNPSAMGVVFQSPEQVPALPVAPRVGSAEWGGAVGEKVVWMVNQSHQVAELHLNPPNLGPLEVRLTISNDQASALFVSHHSAVREAIETALPRLREMLADNGIMLGNVTVGSESFSQQQTFDHRDSKGGGRSGLGAESVMAQLAVPGRPAGLVRDGMVDIFA